MTPQWGEQVYTYYGVEPVWKGGMEKGGESGSAEPPGAGTDRDR
jgi:hypothetical protein